jgi:hypothetical protein
MCRRRTWWWLPVTVIAAVVLAAAAGFSIARSDDASGLPIQVDRHASAGIVRVAYPSEWHPEATGTAIPGLEDQLRLQYGRPTDTALVIGVGVTGDPSLLPRSLLSARAGLPPAETVQLGGLQFYRYLNVLPSAGGGVESVYALRTTNGNMIGICTGHGPGTRVTSVCESILRTVRLSAAIPLIPGPDGQYARALDAVIGNLNVVRRQAGALLASRRPRLQIEAMEALAQAHAAAAQRLATINANQVGAADNELIDALRTTGDSYRALASAAGRNDTRGYHQAEVTLARAMKSVNSAFAALRRLGYRVN